jgi:excisionase family DNA binding protein
VTTAPTISSRPTPRRPHQPQRHPSSAESRSIWRSDPTETAAHPRESEAPRPSRYDHGPQHDDQPDPRTESADDDDQSLPWSPIVPVPTAPQRIKQPQGKQAPPADGAPVFPQLPSGIRPIAYTPEQAAVLLAVRPSWLRRAAAEGEIACTYLGKHLRFSDADLHAIIADNAAGPRPD